MYGLWSGYEKSDSRVKNQLNFAQIAEFFAIFRRAVSPAEPVCPRTFVL